MHAVWFGRVLALLVLGAAIALGARAATALDDLDVGFVDTMWVFLGVAIVPVSIGFLILVVAELAQAVFVSRRS